MSDNGSENTRIGENVPNNVNNNVEKGTPSAPTNVLSPMDPDSPMNWPLWKKVYTSWVAFSFSFVVLYGVTTYVVALDDVVKGFGTSLHVAILGYSIPFFGVMFAPMISPHLSEAFGRRRVYFVCIPLYALCVVVTGLAPGINTLLAFRFLAGLFGGPCVILIEGTFADIWTAKRTVTYYACLNSGAYLGASFGPLIGGFVLSAHDPAWLSWVVLLFTTFALAFGAFMPETYAREIIRTRARYQGTKLTLPPAPSGTTLLEMVHITVVNPAIMFFTEPLVTLISLYVGLLFAVVFQFFIAVPVVLNLIYKFDTNDQGLSFLVAVVGTILGTLSTIAVEQFTFNTSRGKKYPVENRMLPAIVGSLLSLAGLWWVGYTASPAYNQVVPIIAVGVYVWGNVMSITSFVSYLFDIFTPRESLGALASAAVFRIIAAGIVPIFIINMILNLGGKWAYGTFGIITAVFLFVPIGIYMFGAKLREKSRYMKGMTTLDMEDMARNEGRPSTA